ncbi:MAG: hypothetical protein QOG49_540 [Frankiaceae bacterium]|jgi:hypothetical protein|nr:hypothetical protein [Frankiaceae bacterium]
MSTVVQQLTAAMNDHVERDGDDIEQTVEALSGRQPRLR